MPDREADRFAVLFLRCNRAFAFKIGGFGHKLANKERFANLSALLKLVPQCVTFSTFSPY